MVTNASEEPDASNFSAEEVIWRWREQSLQNTGYHVHCDASPKTAVLTLTTTMTSNLNNITEKDKFQFLKISDYEGNIILQFPCYLQTHSKEIPVLVWSLQHD